MNQEDLEKVARLAGQIEDDIENQFFIDLRARSIANLINEDEQKTANKIRELIKHEKLARQKAGDRQLARLLFMILTVICRMEPQLALAFCSFVDGGGGGGFQPISGMGV